MKKWHKTGPAIMAIMNSAKSDACVLWQHGRDSQGYGRASMPGFSTRLAHRIICEMRHGAPIGRVLALHSCGNGHLGCVNPEHLSWGTAKENSDDKVAHGTKPLGRATGRAKLSPDAIRDIRNRRQKGQSFGEISKDHSVQRATIQAVLEGRTWRHIV